MATNNSTIPTAPRLTGNIPVDMQAIVLWASDLYKVVVVEQQIPTRLNQIANLAQLTTAISDPPTKAEVEEIRDAVNAIILAAAPATT